MNWKALITDSDNCVSVGRVSFWVVFVLCILYWSRGIFIIYTQIQETLVQYNPPDSLMNVFLYLLGYELFKKGRDIYRYQIDMKNQKLTAEKEAINETSAPTIQ